MWNEASRKIEYEVQILVPKPHRSGERWLPLGKPHSNITEAGDALDDLEMSVGATMTPEAARLWRGLRLRVMEKVTTCVYGDEIHV